MAELVKRSEPANSNPGLRIVQTDVIVNQGLDGALDANGKPCGVVVHVSGSAENLKNSQKTPIGPRRPHGRAGFELQKAPEDPRRPQQTTKYITGVEVSGTKRVDLGHHRRRKHR